MRIKENLTLQDLMYDFFEIRNIGRSTRTDRLYDASHLIGRFSYDEWLDKPVIFITMYSGITEQTYDAYYIEVPVIKAGTLVIQPTDFIWKIFHNKQNQIVFQAIKNTMEKHYNIDCEILVRKDAVTNTQDIQYNIRTLDGKYFCFAQESPNLLIGVGWGFFWTTANRDVFKAILPSEEYHHYRLCMSGRDTDEGVYIDLDSSNVVGLDELIPNFNRQEFINNFITEMGLLVDI